MNRLSLYERRPAVLVVSFASLLSVGPVSRRRAVVLVVCYFQWREVARELEGVIRIGAVNCDDDWHLCQRQNIHSYPSLIMYPKVTTSQLCKHNYVYIWIMFGLCTHICDTTIHLILMFICFGRLEMCCNFYSQTMRVNVTKLLGGL